MHPALRPHLKNIEYIYLAACFLPCLRKLFLFWLLTQGSGCLKNACGLLQKCSCRGNNFRDQLIYEYVAIKLETSIFFVRTVACAGRGVCPGGRPAPTSGRQFHPGHCRHGRHPLFGIAAGTYPNSRCSRALLYPSVGFWRRAFQHGSISATPVCQAGRL